jgi:hypothetical protein
VSASGYTGNPPGSGGGGGGAWSDITGKPSTFPPSAHTHATADVTGLDAALAGKAPTAHTHTTANVTGLDAALAGKAPTSHTHAIGDTTGLQAALDAKAPVVMAWNGSAYVATLTATVYVGPSDPGAVPDGSVWIDTTP